MLPTTTTLSVTASFVVLTLNSLITAENCGDLGQHFYDSLKCTPNYAKGKKCPVSYNCPRFNYTQESCTFNGKQYKWGEAIPDTHYCNVACFCDDYKEQINPITCAAVDCPYFPDQEEKKCYLAYKLAGCCPIKQVCEPFDNIAKCELNGKTYMEGQTMETGNCWLCVCQKGFKGKIEEPYCTKRPCDLEIYESENIANKCAPVYRGSDKEKALCCPWTFLCPNDVKSELAITKGGSNSQNDKCTFMKRKFNVGDSFQTKYTNGRFSNDIQNVTCKCLLPPLMTCFE